MAEVAAESTKVWNVKARIAVFLASMRHFREALREKGWRVDYHELGKHETLVDALRASVLSLKPSELIMVQAGEWGVQRDLESAAAELSVPLEVREDRHFLCTPAEFAEHAAGRKQLRMEFFYREMRQRTGLLMEKDGPAGGQWNFDHDNRGTFGKEGPDLLRVPPKRFLPDEITREVIALVEERFARHPGTLKDFDWPVTAAQSLEALEDFIAHRLRDFGQYQDAMWMNEPWLYHSRLSAAMNLKMLDPRVVIAAAEKAWRTGKAPLAAVEGFIRQILGWREYVRGIYWLKMPDYVRMNEMQAHEKLPAFYWTGKTDMNCLSQAIGQTLRYGYAHHIQRLMVTGLFALLYGVDPHQVHEWYLAVYVDAVEWVELPNTAGMALHAAGTRFTSKPYAAGGAYVDRMSDYCKGCRYSPTVRSGPKACPMTVLFWGFVDRHEARLSANPRTSMMPRNLARMGEDARASIRVEAARMLDGIDGL